MNKIGVVLGVAAVTVLAGCLDPNYKGTRKVFTPANPEPPAQTDTTVNQPVTPEPKPVQPAVDETTSIEVTNEPTVKPVETKPVVSTPAEPETTVYIVQRGDTLAKISKRYNITQSAIKRANPKMKGDVVRLGQKLVLPGKVEVGEQTVPEGAFAKPAQKPVAAQPAPYTGATADYVVQKGDVLGTIARKHGCTVKQLKELNGMTSDVVVVDKKIKVPAAKAAAPAVATTKASETKPVVKPVPVKEAKPVVAEKKVEEKPVAVEATAEKVEEDVKVEEPVATPAPSAERFVNYTVQEGDDLIGISINCDLTVSEIRQINNLSDDAKVTPGMVLKLPADSVQ